MPRISQTWISTAQLAGLASIALVSACSSGSGQSSEHLGQTQSALSTDATPYLYLQCNATGWNVGESNRLQPTSDPATFTLTYSVTQPWLVGSPDRCLIVGTNQLDGYGTTQTYYSDTNPQTPVSSPATGALVESNQPFTVSYPAAGQYVATVNTQTNTFSIAPANGIIGDCGLGKLGTDPSVQVDYVLVYQSSLARWCVDANLWADPANAAAIPRFFAYGDAFLAQLESLFQVTLNAPFTIQLTNPTGSACDGCSDFGFGETVTGDAFANDFDDPVSGASIPGFWGYLLTLHEAINYFTGAQVSFHGWPADWWADHRSPFPNMLDENVMRAVGTQLNDSNLLAAATAQHERMSVSTLPGYDPEVAMFDTIYDQYGGFTPFENAFRLLQQDQLVADDVDSGKNPSARLSEYVIAYLQLGMHTTKDLTKSLFVASGVGSLDTTIGSYTVSTSAVRQIANDHCSIRAAAAAGVDVSAPLAALQKGKYASAIATGGTAQTCPAECTWSASSATCKAPW